MKYIGAAYILWLAIHIVFSKPSTENAEQSESFLKGFMLQFVNVKINNSEYDYHTLVKVAEMAGLAGLVGFHKSEDGYIVSFPDTENTQALIKDYKARLRDLENNIW